MMKQDTEGTKQRRLGRAADERKAIARWARENYDNLVRSKYGSVVWGRGRQWEDYGATFWANGSGWFNAGVRVAAGQVIVENSRGQEVGRVPLAAIAVQVVALLDPPGWADWTIKEGVGLLIYADWLDEEGKKRWASRIRRWGTEAMKHGGSPWKAKRRARWTPKL